MCRVQKNPEHTSTKTAKGPVTTAWQEYAAHKTVYTLYLTKEETLQQVNYSDIFTPDPDAMRTEVTDAWKYAKEVGNDAVLNRINSGYYAHTLYGIDRSGTILAASPERQYAVGGNYLNMYDTYGVAYLQQAVHTASGRGISDLLYSVEYCLDVGDVGVPDRICHARG